MNIREEVTLSRSAEAVMIPSGEKVLVPEGARATITQSLGGSYTLITERGLMVRISGKEVEAIGKTPQTVPG
ncbi:MAG TPA: putative Fe-S cluster assembly protein SufT, partial [Thermoanaerobaculia bacterium]|nr:putative Fe-S cluster assembly protein SufT [Thermoanaerobaculia bacterium]